MYDYMYLVTYNSLTFKRMLQNPLLNFTTPVNIETGEIENVENGDWVFQTAYNYELKFKIYKTGRIEIKGSLHKFYNFVIKNNLGNSNDFKLVEVIEAIDFLSEFFELNLKETTIHTLEVGLNLKLINISCNYVLDHIIAFKNLSFQKMNLGMSKGKGLDVYFSQYGIKFYNKGVQYNSFEQILRFEIKYLKMQPLKRKYTLVDLKSLDCWNDMYFRLVKAVEDVIFIDHFDSKRMGKGDNNLMLIVSNPRNWESVDYRKRYRLKEQLEILIEEKGTYKFKHYLIEAMHNCYTTI